MAYKVLYSEDALDDLEAILDYIRADNPKAAERFGTALLNHIDLLQRFPYIGSPVVGREGVRQMINTPILIYYHVQENPKVVEILHFWHGSRYRPQS
jgi:plasmid stabilization system protein ParE